MGGGQFVHKPPRGEPTVGTVGMVEAACSCVERSMGAAKADDKREVWAGSEPGARDMLWRGHGIAPKEFRRSFLVLP